MAGSVLASTCIEAMPSTSTLPARPRGCLAHRVFSILPPLGLSALLALLLLPGSCGFGSAAVANTVGNSQSNANPVVSDLAVVDPSDPSRRASTSPAQVRFRLTDEDGDPSTVSIVYSNDAGGSFRPITTSTTLAGLAQGEYQLDWDYTGDLGGESFTSDVQVRAEVVGGNSVLEPQIAIGNDPPRIHPDGFIMPAASPDPEGNVQVRFEVSDSAGDQVDIRVEFNRDAAGNFPSTSWQLARPVGVDAAMDTPLFALNNLEPPFGGEGLSVDFFWESDFDPAPNSSVSAQMASLESDVKLRFTPVDAFGSVGQPVETGVFRIDNNAVPRVDLDEIAFFNGAKDRGNIPIRFKVFDDESDDVQVAIQWKSGVGAYPTVRNAAGQEVDLATLSAEELRDLLLDPARELDRRDAQIAREAPPAFMGRLGAPAGGVAADEAHLPEVASSQAGLLALGIEGRTLEVIRSAQPVVVQWGATALNSPVDVHLLGQGMTALVLDQVGVSSDWQVREIDLATGAVVSTLAQGSGAPKCMDVDRRGGALFVGSSTHIFRLDPFTGQQIAAPLSHGFSDGPRGLAALGDQVVLATGDALVGGSLDGQLRRFDFSSNAPITEVVLLSGLATPWGLAPDPLRATAVYLAERDFVNGGADPDGRVVAVDLNQLVLAPIPALVRPDDVGELSATPFPRPTSIALEAGGSGLLAVTEFGGAVRRLRRLALRSPWDLSEPQDAVADPFVAEVAALGEIVGGIATGPDRLRVGTLPVSGLLAIGGGAAQRRSILAYNPATRVVTLDSDLDPVLSAADGAEWRVRAAMGATAGSPDGLDFSYVWDSSEVPDSAAVEVRVIAQDADPGIAGASTVSKLYRTAFESAAPLSSAPSGSSAPNGYGPRASAAADLDGDGDMDLVSANATNNDLTLYLQTSPGVFAAQDTLHTGQSPRHVAAADLDGDGGVDLVSANFGSASLSLFKQAPPGGFSQTPVTLNVGAQPAAVALADLNGDGNTDLVSANSGSNSLTLWFQDETAPNGFGPTATTLSTGAEPRFVAAADLDRDGDLDLVTADYLGNTLTLFFQDDTTPGVFSTPGIALPIQAAGAPLAGGPRAVAAADLDGDGDMDLVSANAVFDNLTLFLQGGAGDFTWAATLPTRRDPSAVAAADLDGDGDIDLVTANQIGQDLTVYFQTSPGGFTAAGETLPVGGSTWSVIASDLDGDGDMDLVSPNDTQDNLQLFFQAGPVSFNQAPVSLGAGQEPAAVTAADLDGDGDLDLVSANVVSDDLRLLFQTSPGVFVPAASPLPDGAGTNAVVAADLDGNGYLDLVSANFNTSKLRLHYQASPGVFVQNATLLDAGVFADDVIAADINGDGDLDLVAAARDSSLLRLYYQGATGEFDNPVSLSGVGNPVSVAAADLDGDGLVDLVSADITGQRLVLSFQPTTGFNPPTTTPSTVTLQTGIQPRQVIAADLDGDGDLDLASANFIDSNLTLFFQTGHRVFTPAPNALPTGNSCVSVAAADLDGDGDIDLVAANEFSDDLTLYLQVAPGVFRRAAASPITGSRPVWVTAADLDGDGDVDLVSANRVGDDLSLFFNGK